MHVCRIAGHSFGILPWREQAGGRNLRSYPGGCSFVWSEIQERGWGKRLLHDTAL